MPLDWGGIVSQEDSKLARELPFISDQLRSRFSLRNRILPHPTPRMATKDSFKAQPSALEYPPFSDSLYHVMTTGGMISTRGSEYGRKYFLINFHWTYDKIIEELHKDITFLKSLSERR